MIVGTAETESKHTQEYFERAASALGALKSDGLEFVVEPIHPAELDRYNLNGLFEVTYAQIAHALFTAIRLQAARVAADDYRIGGPFEAILATAGARGVEVFKEHDRRTSTLRPSERSRDSKPPQLNKGQEG